MEFSILPFTLEDQLILATLVYTNFGPFVSRDEKITIKEACKRVLSVDFKPENFRVRNDYLLIKAILDAPRFSSLYISDVEERFDKGLTQFFALTIHLDKAKLIAYRGTDNTVTGWKEDFEMAYEPEVPSQREALKYLNRIARKYSSPLMLTGHSKGGNLAVYAAANTTDRVKKRIKAVYNNDGPGFNEASRTHETISSISDRIVTIIPQCSFIGMLMEHSDDYHIVSSSARLVLQHDPYSWLFDGPRFKYEKERTQNSVLFERVVSTWLRNASREEREGFVDGAFKCLSATGVDNFSGSNFEILFRTPDVIKRYRALDDKEKAVIKKVVVKLIQATRENIGKTILGN